MKKILPLALLLTLVTPITANASCGAGESMGLEVNVATRTQTYYCYKPIEPTQQELENKVKETLTQKISEEKNANTSTIVAETVITKEIQPTENNYGGISVDATTGEVTVNYYDEKIITEIVRNETQNVARREAQTEATRLASENQGTEICVNWVVHEETGSECRFDPIPVTEEEVQVEYNALQELMAFDWSAFLQLWRWHW